MMSEPYFERLITESSTISTLSNLSLVDIIPLSRLQALQEVFSAAHDIGSVITDLEGNWITRPSQFSPVCGVFRESDLGKERCCRTMRDLCETLRQNRAPAWRSCLNCELVEGGIPLIAGDRHVGNWLIGQVNALNIDQGRIEEHAWTHGVDIGKVRGALAQLTAMPMKQYEQRLNCLSLFAEEVVQQAYRSYFLQGELQRAKEQEKDSREKGMDLAHSSAEMQRFLRSLAYDLQVLLKEAAGYAGKDDTLSPALSAAESRQIAAKQLSAIRKIYRSILQAMAGSHAAVAEAERDIVRGKLLRKKGHSQD